MTDLTPEEKIASTRHFALLLALVVALAAALPAIANVLSAPSGSSYIGSVYNTDDHMVYAAWMRQAMDGHLLFDNRFTTDLQPGLTIHLYYFALGLLANVTGIALASNLARIILSGVFVWLLYRLVRKLDWGVHARKLAVVLPVIAGGIGFVVWHTFGQAIVKPTAPALSSLMLGRLPIDVWQPEAFVFPSMLSNGLFMASLCLIITVFICVLRATESRKCTLLGALAMFLLMNIHSYDVLLIALVLVGLLAATFSNGPPSKTWVLRSVLIGLGAVPAALWFVYVLKNDSVFQARAATETFSPNFRQVLLGLLLPILGGLWGLAARPTTSDAQRLRRWIGLGIVIAMLTGLFVCAAGKVQEGFFLSAPVWAALFLATLAAIYLLADESSVVNLFLAWALIGLVAIYFPALFQRKLAVGIVIPWSVLAAYGVAALLSKQERSARNLATALVIILFGASSVRWAFRELSLGAANVSNTTLLPVYLSENEQRIVDYLNRDPSRKVVVAMPGIPSPVFTNNQQESAPSSQLGPIIPDLNPIVSGLAGAYTYAGHWSETPDYLKRRVELTRLFLPSTSEDARAAQLKSIQANYVVAPTQESLPNLPLFDFRALGEVVVDGAQFRLIKLR